MAEIIGCISEWESNYVPQVVYVMLCFNDFMEKQLIWVLFPMRFMTNTNK